MGKYKKIIFVICVALLGIILYKTGILENISDREKITVFINKMGNYGPLVYIVIYMLVTITCISTLPLTLVGGLLFGGVKGVLYTAIGAGFGLALAFVISRYIAREYIEKKFGNTEAFKKINAGVEKEGWFILATTRLIPIFPFGIQNYIYGLTSMSFIKYTILSVIFILPGTSVYVLLAGAVASGDKEKALKMSLLASLIFFLITVVTKLISKKRK